MCVAISRRVSGIRNWLRWQQLWTIVFLLLTPIATAFAAGVPASGNRTCASAQFACDSGQCIDQAWRCDGQKDCPSGSDEASCSDQCPDGQFSCKDGSRCVDSRWKCDGENDCPDGSDEQQCDPAAPRPTVSSCPADRFRCDDSSSCLSLRWLCDGEKDCLDGSDETQQLCNRLSSAAPGSRSSGGGSGAGSGARPGLLCTAHEFACTSGRCIPLFFRCDSADDCGDHSDEVNCTCSAGQFACSEPHQCIPSKFRCSGQQECMDGTDEKDCPRQGTQPPTTTATVAAGRQCTGAPCQHECHAGVCTCKPGYRLLANGISCADIDECSDVAQPTPCSQLCSNLAGSYRCGCLDGYEINPVDNRSCKAVGERPYVVFANRIDIRQLRPGAPGEYTVVVNKGKSILALDIDESQRVVYYSDTHDEVIYRANLQSAVVSGGEIESLVNKDIGTVDGIAYDWIYKKVYWTDAQTKEVSAVETSHPRRRVVLISDLSEPRAIVLHPSRGLMFFSDWGRPAIYRAGMDGQSLTAIVTDDIGWPNGIALDHTTELVYWIDAKLKSIRMSDLDGQNQRVVVSSDHQAINNPFAVSVFEDTVYWSERGNMTIMAAHKLTGANVTVLLKDTVNGGEPLDVKVHHAARQPPGVNRCSSNPCEQLCFPAASWPDVGATVSCRCVVGYSLDANKRTCSPTRTSTTDVVANLAAAADQEQPTLGKGGVIAGIAMAVLVALCVLVVLLVLFVRRHCVNERTVNFDNPVYQKTTTDDKLDLKGHEQRPSVTTPAVLQPLNTNEAQAAADECEA